MATIPSQHAVGDVGHTDDHNAVVDVLHDHETRVRAIEGVQPTYMVKTGGNTVSLTNPSGVSESLVIPSGDRDPDAYVKTVSYGSRRTFGLDTYGQLRVGAARDDTVPAEFFGQSADHTADLTRWRKTGVLGPVVTRITADGNIIAPNITPTQWFNLVLAPGIAWNPALGARPSYRLVGEMLELRGNVKRSNNADFTDTPQDVGTLPAHLTPHNIVYSVQASTFRSGYAWVRLEILTSGLIRFFYQASEYNPDWMSLDGITFSLFE